MHWTTTGHMSLFDNLLKDNESLIKNELPLNPEFVPKIFMYREKQQQVIASCMAPLFNNRSGRNAVIVGPPGVGKTLAVKKVVEELEEKTDQIVPLYINCWKKNTTYKILLDLCEQLDYRFTHNKKTDELVDIVIKRLNKFGAVLIFDEVDKCEDTDFLYMLMEGLLQKSIILLTNYRSFIDDLDERIASRLVPQLIHFEPYSKIEVQGILNQRREYAFPEGVWKKSAFVIVVDETYALRDIRAGLYLLKESAMSAEESASRLIENKHVQIAVNKLEEFKIKKVEDLDDDAQSVLDIVKNGSPCKIGDAFKAYTDNGGKGSYKTFQRKIAKLEEAHFIAVKKTQGGAEGNTSILSYNTNKTLDDF